MIVSLFSSEGRSMAGVDVYIEGGIYLVAESEGIRQIQLKLLFGVDADRVDAMVAGGSHLLVKLPYADIAQSRVRVLAPFSASRCDDTEGLCLIHSYFYWGS